MNEGGRCRTPDSELLTQIQPMRYKALLPIAILLAAQSAWAQSHRGTFVLTNARIETITRGTIDRGSLLIRDGKIIDLGPSVPAPLDAETIDCTGLTIYPGMIDAGTQLGLIEI